MLDESRLGRKYLNLGTQPNLIHILYAVSFIFRLS